MARQPLTPVTQAAPLRSECLPDPDERQRGVDANAKSAGNAHWLQLPAATPIHWEVVSRGHQAFVRPSDGCANAEASVAGPYLEDVCRPPSAPCGVGAGPTSWNALPTWQPPDGHAPPLTERVMRAAEDGHETANPSPPYRKAPGAKLTPRRHHHLS